MLSISLQSTSELWTRGIVFNFLPFIFLGLALLCWRLWTFTITPRLKPLEPKELPYWIPYLGHVRSFFKDYNGALEEGRKYFQDTKELYSVWIAGTRIYIFTSPEDVASLDRNTTTVSYHNVIKDMYRWIGVSEDGFNKTFTLNPAAKHNADMAHPKAPAIMINEYHRRQTKPGELFDDLLHRRSIPGIEQTLAAVIKGSSPSVVEKSTDGVTVSLLRMCTTIFASGTTNSFLGKKIWEVNPNLLDSFVLWERTNWKYMFQMPKVISGDMIQARDDIIKSFVEYFRIPAEGRRDGNYFTMSVEALMRDVGCNEKDMARVFMLHFWAILSNMYQIAFWALAYIAYDPSLHKTIHTECEPAVKGDLLDESYLAEKCPLLESFISETLRLTVASPLVREVTAPTHIRGKTLQPGSKVLVSTRQLHLNRSVWGADPLTATPHRFAKDPKLYSSKSYRPFGGGDTLCPGRFLAKRTLGYVIAAIVTRFEISVDVEKTRRAVGEKGKEGIASVRFPEMDHTKPSPGAGLPVKGEDVFLVLREKRKMK